MATFRLCRSCGDLHQLGRWPHNCLPDAPNRSDLPAPYIISDTLPGGVNGLMHHGIGKRIDSKSGYRRATKDSGCIEVGNEYVATAKRDYRDNLKTEVIESAVNEALHRQGVSSECDVGEFIT